MKYCKTCHIHYDTPLETCMFCNAELEDNQQDVLSYKFAEVKKRSASRFFYRLFIFLNIVSIIVSLYLDYADGLPLEWSLIVGITNIYAVSMFIMLIIPTLWTSKLTKGIILTTGSLILIGLAINDYSWALDIVFPFAVLTNTFLITILILVNKKKWFDYFSSLIVISIIGLLPGLFNVLGFTTIQWPSLICFAYSAFTIIGIIALPSKTMRDEFKRRFHI